MGGTIALGIHDYPRQKLAQGTAVEVSFLHDESAFVGGTIMRDDAVDPEVTVIQLSDGRVVLGSECEWRLRTET